MDTWTPITLNLSGSVRFSIRARVIARVTVRAVVRGVVKFHQHNGGPSCKYIPQLLSNLPQDVCTRIL